MTASGDPTIAADADRGLSGKLDAREVEGKRFTPNGQVLGHDAHGRLRGERQPVTSGLNSSEVLNPAREPDCQG